MKYTRFWQGLLATAFLFTGFAAHADLILTLDDGEGNVETVSDDDGDGFVNFLGAVGTWSINTTSGFTNPLIGSEYVDEMDLVSANVSGGAGSITLTLTRTGLDGSPANWIANLGGTTSGTVDFSVLLNGIVISQYLASTAAYSYSDSGQINELEPYSLSLVATITHSGSSQVSSFDYHVKVPEPSTLALLGSGLLLTGWVGARRRRQSAN